ncbi:MAG: GNAT family N-acetyltransferase [Rhodospirillaceae bacterium]|jgi:ribosomal protein S18 acetylase RimI-like enzyme|nr:GNAT family N-acetyltransferase [Rhodospirillaceae bacterium]
MVTLRAARQSDAPAIARVHVESWRTTYAGMLPDSYLLSLDVDQRTVFWARLLKPRGDSVVVAEDEKAGVIGFGSCGPIRPEEQPQSGDGWLGEIYTLYLLSDWHGQGLGRSMLDWLLQRLRARGLDRILLWVVEANPTRFFYEAMGAKVIARRREPFAGVLLDELAYGWSPS